jgi:hypothetical protein
MGSTLAVRLPTRAARTRPNEKIRAVFIIMEGNAVAPRRVTEVLAWIKPKSVFVNKHG